MPRRQTMTRSAFAAVAAAALVGAATGAGTYALLDPSGSTTVVRQVTVGGETEPASTGTGLSAGQIYERAYRSVVEITVTASGGGFGPGGGQQTSQGSGFVYDRQGHVITNEHVVDGADSVSIRFSNGSTYEATVVGTDPSSDLAVLKVTRPRRSSARSSSPIRAQSTSATTSRRSEARSASRGRSRAGSSARSTAR